MVIFRIGQIGGHENDPSGVMLPPLAGVISATIDV
jgi:hypothetical protein